MPIEKKIKFIELNYHCQTELSSAGEIIEKHLPSNLFARSFRDVAEIIFVKHACFEQSAIKDGLHYEFFKSSSRFAHIPYKTHQFIKKQDPDLILVQGFIFPLQLIFLRCMVGKKPVIILQHHGESPAGKKMNFQRLADRFVNGYVFSSAGNAKPWIEKKIISPVGKCFEMPSSSTLFQKRDKEECRRQLGMGAGLNFLWVGRLNSNKDPFTVLHAFEKFLIDKRACLWMLYGHDEMSTGIKNMLAKNERLSSSVKMVGARPHDELEKWYSAADYYINASHREGVSYALTEAMACGCIPIVSSIPPSIKAIDNGKAGYFFEPGDSESLYQVMNELDVSGLAEISEKVIERFNQHFSPEAIANRLQQIYLQNKPVPVHG